MQEIRTDKPHVLYLDADQDKGCHFQEQYDHCFKVSIALNCQEASQVLRDKEIHAVLATTSAGTETILQFFTDISASFKDIFRLLILTEPDCEILQRAINTAHIHHAFIAPVSEKELRTVIQQEMGNLRQEQRLATQIRQVELEEASRQAETASKSKSAFLSKMSHEIRTPLNAVIGMTHLILNTKISTKQQDYLEKIDQASHNLLNIVNDILDLSKIEAGKLELESAAFNLDEIIQRASDIISANQTNPEVELIIATQENLPCNLMGDPQRLNQILINLINNAAKFTHQGEIIVNTELIQETKHDVSLRFAVMDTGIGMTPSQQAEIFKAFSQLNCTNQPEEGTGLGLTISRLLVSLMGGKLQVESQVGQGSTFSFELTFAKADEDTAYGLQLPKSLRNLRVLVVDDNSTVQRIFQISLKAMGLSSQLAASGEQALTATQKAEAEKRPFDLILMDWKMEGMDGLECANIIKRSSAADSRPAIIIVTAYGQDEIIRKTESMGMNGLLFKPVNRKALAKAIGQAFKKKSAPSSPRRDLPTPQEQILLNKTANRHILLVEDNILNQQVAKELLESWGILVTTALNGAEAVERVKQQEFDLVLMDIQMPVMDGLTASRHIRDLEHAGLGPLQDKAMPILAMTAYAMSSDKARCLEAGMNGHVSKPIDPNELMSSMLKWLPLPATPEKHTLTMPSQGATSSLNLQQLPESLPGIEIESSLRRLAGNRRLLRSLLIQFASDYREILPIIGKYIANDQFDEAQKLVRTLKSVSGNIGAVAVSETASNLEADMRGKRAYINDLFSNLQQTMIPLQIALASEFPELAFQSEATNGQNIPPDQITQLRQLANLVASHAPESRALFYTLRHTLLSIDNDEAWVLQELLEQQEYNDAEAILTDMLTTISNH